MSEHVTKKGKLRLINKIENETLEEQCERILKDNFDDFKSVSNFFDSYYSSYQQTLVEEYCDYYYIHNDNLYELDCNDLDLYRDIAEGEVKEDGSIDFLTSYYNGGACLHEMLDEVMKKIIK